jgi:hypothetical protein
MAEPYETQTWARDELLGLLSVSGTLAGLCITIVALLNATSKGAATIADDMLAICASAFLACIYLVFWTLKTNNRKRAWMLMRFIDVLFLSALSAMTLAGFVMVYTIL